MNRDVHANERRTSLTRGAMPAFRQPIARACAGAFKIACAHDRNRGVSGGN